MRFTTRFVLLVVTVFYVPFALSSAQTAQPAQTNSGQMTIHVAVDTHSGNPVEDLTSDDFTLIDNRRPQPITGFRALKDTQTSVIIVLDAVNLPYSFVSFARQQLAQFLSSNDGRLPQPTTIAVLQDSGIKMRPQFTTNGNDLRSILDQFSIGLREVHRSAGVYGAEEELQISLQAFNNLVSSRLGHGPTRLIWVSPGWPLLSGPEIEIGRSQAKIIFNNIVALTTELHRSQITVDMVNPVGAAADVGRSFFYESFLHAPQNPGDVQIGNLALQVIATQSGGLVLNGSNDVAGLLRHTVAQSGDGYDLTFTPAPGEHDNEYHQLDVKVRRSGVTVHTTAGYYARPNYAPLAPAALAPATH